MERTNHNPWTWQEQFGFEQAVEVREATRTVYCAGQTSIDADGTPQHAGDMAGQMTLAIDNIEAVLGSAGLTLADVVRLNIYVTDLDAVFENYGVVVERLGASGCRYSSTLLEVSRLALPELLIELEATAAA